MHIFLRNAQQQGVIPLIKVHDAAVLSEKEQKKYKAQFGFTITTPEKVSCSISYLYLIIRHSAINLKARMMQNFGQRTFANVLLELLGFRYKIVLL